MYFNPRPASSTPRFSAKTARASLHSPSQVFTRLRSSPISATPQALSPESSGRAQHTRAVQPSLFSRAGRSCLKSADEATPPASSACFAPVRFTASASSHAI